MKKVTFISRNVPDYRAEFYNQLWHLLNKNDIQLQLIYENDEGGSLLNLEWPIFVKNRTFDIGKITLVWQPCLSHIKDSDLVIVEQENTLLINYILILRKMICNRKFAFWGPCINFQASKGCFSNKFKLTFINLSSWWFSHTEGVRQCLIENGVINSKITVVQNAINITTLRSQYLALRINDIEQFKLHLGIGKGCKVLIYSGELSKANNITFLLESIIKLKKQTALKFKLLILGDGTERMAIENFTKNVEDIIFIGPKCGQEKIIYFGMADIFVFPGAVGLNLFEAFVYETPIVTIKHPFHGPEIEYLKNNQNGIITDYDIISFNTEVIRLMMDNKLIESLNYQGLETLKTLNIETMVNNIGKGILDCFQEEIT